MFSRVEADQPQRTLQVGEALFGRRVCAKSQPAPFCNRMQRRILQELRGAPFDPGVRCPCKPSVELLDESRLAKTGLADDEHKLAFAYPRPVPATHHAAHILL